MRAATAGRGTVALAAVGALLLLALATAPWARASTIYACVKKRGGALHVVSKAAKCNRREPKQSWSKSGPTGAMGVESVNGVSGAGGPSGANGVTGATGPAGDEDGTGPPGDPGAKGSSGTTGAAGATGETGASGARGTTGTNGTNGTTGTTGATGAKGEVGATGVTGAGGAVAGYSATNAEVVNFTLGTTEAPTTVVTKEGLPAGTFIGYSKLVVTATDTEVGTTWLAECTLVDKTSSGATTEDTAGATGAVVAARFFDESQATMALGMAVTTTEASNLTLACANVSNSSKSNNFAVRAAHALITAVQTTQNS